MNSTGQNLSVNPLMGAADAAVTADTAKSAAAPPSDDKALKNKGFSDYMQGREESDKSSTSDPTENSVEEVTPVGAGNAGWVAAPAPKAFVAAGSGSALPVAGSHLPSGESIKVTTPTSLLQKSPLVLGMATTENPFAELKEIASATAINTPSTAEVPQAYRSSNGAGLQTAVSVPVGRPGWGESVMQRVMWMSSQNISRAEIALDPPELGPMNVKISSTGDQTSVVFTSNHASVRDALDQSLSRLREMMENQGINLSDVNVSDQSAFQQRQQAEVEGANGEGGADGKLADENPEQFGDESVAMAKPLALIDQYV